MKSNAQPDFTLLTHKIDGYKADLGAHYACVVIQDGKVVYKRETPDFDIKEQGPLGSTSQWLTTALVMWCVDQGMLSLDDKVGKYLPIFENYQKGYLTIRHCLTHQTGLEAPKVTSKLFEQIKYETLEEEVNSYATKRDIITNPGTSFNYNNIGINIAARVVEIVSKKTFEQMVNEKIIKPLSMRVTSFSNTDKVTPASSAVSSAADMGNFLTMIYNKGTFNGKKILSEKAVQDMETLQMDPLFIKNLPLPLTGFTYGMGEWILDKDIEGKSTVVGCPNMYGCWPFIDRCKGYSFVIITKDMLAESKKSFYTDIKKTIDGIITEDKCTGK